MVTVKGQIVIPSKLRLKVGIKKGTQVYVYERDGEIAVEPITEDYIRSIRNDRNKDKGANRQWGKTNDPILVNIDIMGVTAKAPQAQTPQGCFSIFFFQETQLIFHKRHRNSARA